MIIRKRLIIPALAGVAFFAPAAHAAFPDASGVTAKSGLIQLAQAGAEGAKGAAGAAKGGGGPSQGARSSGGGNPGGQGGQAARAPRGPEGGQMRSNSGERRQRSESGERNSRPTAERRVIIERPVMSERSNKPTSEGVRVRRGSGDNSVVIRDRSRRDGVRHRGVRHAWGPGVYFYFYDGYYHGDCAWVRRKAISTGSAYWWRRYRQCRAY